MRRAKSREGLTGDAGEAGAPPLAEQLTAERARADALASELAALKTRLQVAENSALVKCGYLFKYRPWAEGVFKDPWVKRFFSLVGNTLLSYKSEHDAAHLPRASMTLDAGCTVELEGWKRRRYWTWSVRDESGGLLARLSSASSAEGEAWVAALRAAGAHVVPRAPDGLFGREPPPPPLQAAMSAASRPEFGDEGVGSPSPGMALPRSPLPASPAQHAASSVRHPKKPFAGMRGSTPIHKEPNHSPLSSERLLYSSQAGLVNLVMIILVVNHCRLILENLTRYGVRVRAGFWVGALGLRDTPRAVPMVVAFLALAIFPLAANALERMAAYAVRRHPGKRSRAERWVGVAHIVLTTCIVAMPCAVIHITQSAPLPGFILLSFALVLWMKLVSYAHANADLRGAWVAAAAAKKTEEADASAEAHEETYAISYPDNLSLSNLTYFVFAPTLCYQPSYPLSPRFRPRWLLRRLAELAVFGALMALIIEQYMLPAARNSAGAFSERPLRPLRCAERLLKLSIPTLYVWLCIFYCFFHCWLNALGELLRFGDRGFYREWWNATTIEQYWRLWNIPVHKWLTRHVYFPAMRHGFTRTQALSVTFFFSAAAHELLIGVPCHVLRGWAFMGIMAQVPLIALTEWTARKLKNDQAGNVIFWLSFCIFGQPMAVLLYYMDVMARTQGAASFAGETRAH